MKYLDEALRELAAKDKRWQVIINNCPALEYGPPDTPYIGLTSSIASQQLSTKVARVIWKRFEDLFGGRYPVPGEVLAMEDIRLRLIGFSNAKVQYIKNIARYFEENAHSRDSLLMMQDEEVLAELTAIKGVGEWTVQMLQIFDLHRPDIWPVKDLGVQQGFAGMYNLDLPVKELVIIMKEEAINWQPYRSAAALLLWKWKDIGFQGIDDVHTLNKKRKRKK